MEKTVGGSDLWHDVSMCLVGGASRMLRRKHTCDWCLAQGPTDGGRAFSIYSSAICKNVVAPMSRRADFQGVGPILGGALHSRSRGCCPDSKKHGGRHRRLSTERCPGRSAG